MTQAHGPIKTNDDWIAEASHYFSDVMTKYLLGSPMKPIERRLIDILRAKIGTMPESPKRYTERLAQEEVGTYDPHVQASANTGNNSRA
jgi:hypothetical protein